MGHIYHPVKNLHPKMFPWRYVIIAISRVFLDSDYNGQNQGFFMLEWLESQMLLLLSLLLLPHINIINCLLFLHKNAKNHDYGLP